MIQLVTTVWDSYAVVKVGQAQACARLHAAVFLDENPDWHSPVDRVGTKITIKVHNSGANMKMWRRGAVIWASAGNHVLMVTHFER
jgi:hypothetical protein